MRKRTIRLNHEVENLRIYHLEQLKLGDRIKIYGINQNLPEEDYDISKYRLGDFIKNYEKEAHSRHRLTVPIDRFGKRYILIEKISGMF